MQHQATGSDITKTLIYLIRFLLRLNLLFSFRLSSIASLVNIFTAYISLILALSSFLLSVPPFDYCFHHVFFSLPLLSLCVYSMIILFPSVQGGGGGEKKLFNLGFQWC
jgi:hypothetical protein